MDRKIEKWSQDYPVTGITIAIYIEQQLRASYGKEVRTVWSKKIFFIQKLSYKDRVDTWQEQAKQMRTNE